MLEKTSTKFLLLVIVFLIFHNSREIIRGNPEQKPVNPCPNCCLTDTNRLFVDRHVPEEEKILVPLFDIDQENQILGLREALLFARQLNTPGLFLYLP